MRKIPNKIKIEILRKYLEGDSIPQISSMYNVSVGAVYSITEETKKDMFFQAIREIAKIIRKENFTIYDLIPTMHLHSKIRELGLTSEFFQNLLDLADEESFRVNMNLEEFVNKIRMIVALEKSNQIPIQEILELLENAKNQLDELRREKEMIEKEINNLCGNIGLLKSQILEYIKDLPLFHRYKEDTDVFYKSVDLSPYRWLFEEANNKIGRHIDPEIL